MAKPLNKPSYPSVYNPRDFGGAAEENLIRKFRLQRNDARDYFISCIKPRLDRSYKLYVGSNLDRQKEIKQWQANVFLPYIHGIVESLMPRILDARPDFAVHGRNEDDQMRADKLENLGNYTWEMSQMDKVSEDLTRSSLVYGTGFMQVSWKKDVRKHKFLTSKNINDAKLTYTEKEQTFYDAPFCEWVDNYSLWYDWHNVPHESKQYWLKRKVLTGADIRRKYPGADRARLDLALHTGYRDIQDYASIRNEVRTVQTKTTKGSDFRSISGFPNNSAIYVRTNDPELRMHEVFEWWRPFDDSYCVMVNEVPIFDGAEMPIPYDFKEAPFIAVPYLRLPGEFEGMGIPLLLENPQIMVNLVKNQRLDAATMSIHKMWIVNPLANIDRKELVTRPFGIIYTPDPNGVREVQFSDIKESAYKEEELLKQDMRYASGVDDYSMGGGGNADSATEIRHLRESTLERVRLFINHLGDGYSRLLRFWIVMYKQFFTTEMTIRIVGDDGKVQFPLVDKDDLRGEFDFVAAVEPSIAGREDLDKKQGMDLFQLLISMPFVDPLKLTSKVLQSWGWPIDAIVKDETAAPPGMPGMPGDPAMAGMPMDPAMAGMPPGMPPMGPGPSGPPSSQPFIAPSKGLSPDVEAMAARLMSAPQGANGPSLFGEASSPIQLTPGMPPTARGIPAGRGGPGGGTSNPRGANRSTQGKVNTNIPTGPSRGSAQGNLLGQAQSTQR